MKLVMIEETLRRGELEALSLSLNDWGYYEISSSGEEEEWTSYDPEEGEE